MRRAAYRSEEGMTLVEVIVAVFILGVAILAIASVTTTSLISTRVSRTRQLATDQASSSLEQVRSYNYDDVGMKAADLAAGVAAGDPNVTVVAGDYYFDHDGPGGDAPELIVVLPGGKIDPYTTTSGVHTIRTYVTWFDDPTTPDPQDAKRVTSISRAVDPSGSTVTAKDSTFVAPARRGLPVPDFVVTPDSLSRTAPSNQVVCFDHALENRGERDRYDFAVTGGVPSADHWKKSGWDVFAYIDADANNTLVAGEKFVDATSDLYPDSQTSVARGETVPLKLCYDPPVGLGSGSSATFEVIIRSAFDSSIQSVVYDQVNVGIPPLELFFHPVSTGNAKNRGQFDMDADVPIATTLANYDTNGQDGDGLPGSRLEKGQTNRSNGSAGPIVFDYQFTNLDEFNTVTLTGVSDVTFWSSWKGPLSGSSGTDLTLRWRIRLQKLNTSGNVTTTLGTWDLSYIHDDEVSWQRLNSIALPFSTLSATDRTFAKDEFLRIRFECRSTSDEDCHLAYDTTTFKSLLTAQVQG